MQDGNNHNPPAPNDGQAGQSAGDEPASVLGQVNPVPPSNEPRLATPKQAADVDLIEKEWVVKAKQIVEHTKEDPHEQLRVMSKFKADYMKKRYNKDIKVSDE